MNRKVKSLMALHGVKNTDIARKLGLSRVTVSVVVTGKGNSRRIKQCIADMLGAPFESLWGARNGHRKGVRKDTGAVSLHKHRF